MRHPREKVPGRALMAPGSPSGGLRVESSGFRVFGILGFRVQDFEILVSEFKVWG